MGVLLTGEDFIRIVLTKHFITIVLIVVYGIKLIAGKKARDVELGYFWITLICCFLLVLEDVAESITAMDPELRWLRIFFSVMGYALRPVAAVGMLLVICPPKRRTWKIWILCFTNAAVYMTAFWSPIAFSYGGNYEFVRGPLGYCVFLVSFFYIVRVLVWTWERFYNGLDTERWILIICALSCIAAAGIDVVYGGCRLNEAMMISSIFFYMFLRSHDNRRDLLTSLDNRYSFYEDIRHRKGITAVLKRSVIRSGYTISAGYAMTKDSESVEDALRESDQNMYKEKAVYYQQNGVDRRKRILNQT